MKRLLSAVAPEFLYNSRGHRDLSSGIFGTTSRYQPCTLASYSQACSQFTRRSGLHRVRLYIVQRRRRERVVTSSYFPHEPSGQTKINDMLGKCARPNQCDILLVNGQLSKAGVVSNENARAAGQIRRNSLGGTLI